VAMMSGLLSSGLLSVAFCPLAFCPSGLLSWSRPIEVEVNRPAQSAEWEKTTRPTGIHFPACFVLEDDTLAH